MVPATLRELASAAARDESELVASDRAADEVLVEDVVRGWIRTTPPEQRKMGNVLLELVPEKNRGDDLIFEIPGDLSRPPDFE